MGICLLENTTPCELKSKVLGLCMVQRLDDKPTHPFFWAANELALYLRVLQIVLT